jgi:hypothetical protein
VKVPNKVLRSVLKLAKNEAIPADNKDYASREEIVAWAQDGVNKRTAPVAAQTEAQ